MIQRVVLSLGGAALLIAPLPAGASELFQLCGPEASGFIRTGRHTVCVGGSLNWKRDSRAPSPAARPAAAAATPQPQPPAATGKP